MAHGIFPTHNKYYLATEIFPFLSKSEKKSVFFPEKVSKKTFTHKPKFIQDDDDAQVKFRKK